jgi:hypothetical protein
MTDITVSRASLLALLEVCNATSEIKQTIELSAVGVSDEGEPVWEESLDWPDLGICYFNLAKALEQAKSETARLQTLINSESDNSPSLKLSAEVKGQENDDLILALDEIKRLLLEGFTSGFNGNETGSYRFTVACSRVSED